MTRPLAHLRNRIDEPSFYVGVITGILLGSAAWIISLVALYLILAL